MQELENQFILSGGSFKEYKIGELFEVKSNPQLNKESFVFSSVGKYPYFTRTVMNNGILGYVEYLDEEHKIKGNSLAVGMLGMQFFYMKSDFYAGQFTKTVYPKFDNFNEKKALYFIVLFNKLQKLLQGVLVRDFERTFYASKISLPTKNNQPDFAFMEEYIHVLETYLQASGLDTYDLTDAEISVLNCLRSGSIVFKQYKIGELFEKQVLKFRKKKFDKNSDISKEPNSEFDLPLVNAKDGNNGIMYWGRSSDFDSVKMSIDIVGDGAVSTGNVYVQPQLTGVLYNAYLVKLKQYEPVVEALLFLAKSVEKSIKNKFGYDNKAGWEKVKNESISLPTKNNRPDFDFMETYIHAVEKIVIKNVVAWKDKEIEKTKEVVA